MSPFGMICPRDVSSCQDKLVKYAESDQLKKILSSVTEKYNKEQFQVGKNYNKNRKDEQYVVGDLVLVRDDQLFAGKSVFRNEGPYKILQCDYERANYQLETKGDSWVNISKLIKYYLAKETVAIKEFRDERGLQSEVEKIED